jgi:hypothetical protein
MDPKIYYLICPVCGKDYYIARALYRIQQSNPEVMLMCPYCQKEFPAKTAKFMGNG